MEIEEKKSQDPAVDAATLEQTSDSSPAPESSKEDSNSGVSQEPLADGDKKPDVDVEDLRQKYSASSKEARLLKEEKEMVQEEFMNFVTQDKSIFQTYLDAKGFSPEEKQQWIEYYDTQVVPQKMKDVTKGPQQAPQATAPQQPSSPPPGNPIRNSWMQREDQKEAQKRNEQRIAWADFLDSPENKSLSPLARETIAMQAGYLDLEKGYSPKEALASARKLVLEADVLRQEGYSEAMQDAYSGVSQGISGSNQSRGSAFQLPKEHEAWIQSEKARKGLSEKQTEELRKGYSLRLQRSKR